VQAAMQATRVDELARRPAQRFGERRTVAVAPCAAWKPT
jgi:hypothetical protein